MLETGSQRSIFPFLHMCTKVVHVTSVASVTEAVGIGLSNNKLRLVYEGDLHPDVDIMPVRTPTLAQPHCCSAIP